MNNNTKKQIIDYISSEKNYILSNEKLKALLKCLYEDYISKTDKLSEEVARLKDENQKMISEHEMSLSIVIENESQKILLEDLNTKLANAYKKLEEESKRDHLTGVYNRKTIISIFEVEFKRISRQREKWEKIKNDIGEDQLNNYRLGNVSCAIIDVDYFKKINDTYGHLIGDQVLRGLSNEFSESLRESDSIGRIGGEEFLIIMPDTSANEAIIPLQKIQKKINSKLFLSSDGKEFNVTFSAGISEYCFKDNLIDDIISKTDKALYYAKQNGRNKIIIYDSIANNLKDIEIEQKEQQKITFILNSSFKSLTNIRNTVREKITLINENAVDAAVITANELCENAIKYGENIAHNQKMKFELIVDEFKIKIIVTNGIADQQNLQELIKTMQLINSSNNTTKLYKSAIKKLLEDDNPGISRLGLFRISAECKYTLSYQINGKVVSITAKKYYT